MVMSFTISKSLAFIVTMTHERLLTFSTNKVFYMPVLAKSSNDSLFDGSLACKTNWYSHFVMATKTVEFILRLIEKNI